MRGWLYGGLLLMLLGNLLGPGSAAATESPQQLVQRLITAISSMKQAANGQVTEAEKAKNTAAAQTANTILDVPGVSQWTLGKHWEKLGPWKVSGKVSKDSFQHLAPSESSGTPSGVEAMRP